MPSKNKRGRTTDLTESELLGFILSSVLTSFSDLVYVTLLLIFCATLWNTNMVTFIKHFANLHEHPQQNLST